MIDIHSHIIPEFDDGSRSLDESLDIARFESKGGTAFMFATPHVESQVQILESSKIVDLVEKLNQQFKEREIALTVIPGAELFPSMSIGRGLDEGKPITLGPSRKYVLLDLPHSQLPLDFDNVLFEIQSRGVTPILAHPERCPAFQPDASLVLPYVEKGIVFQLNMGSFAGRHGPYAEKCAYDIFDMKVAHFLASDAHRMKKFNLGTIANQLRDSDPDYVDLLTRRSGQAVIAGDELPVLPPTVLPKKKKQPWYSRLLTRSS